MILASYKIDQRTEENERQENRRCFMYKFVDTVTKGAQSTPMSIQTIFNEINLDEDLTDENGSFTTLVVNGRGILPRRIDTYATPGSHGLRERSYTYDAREITVKYMLTDLTNEGFRDRFNRLNGLLLGSKKRLEFTDEDAHFIATLYSGDMPDEDSNSIVGTLVFLCSDPAKRKNEQSLEVTTTFQSFVIRGQAEVPWISETVFSIPQSEFIIEMNMGAKVILNFNFSAGDKLIIDSELREITLNGESLMVALSLSSRWITLKPRLVSIRASHPNTLKYVERYY